MNQPRVTFRLVFLLRALLLGLGVAQGSWAQVLTLGVVPQQPAAKLFSLWQPLIEQLRSASGIELAFKTAADIPAFEAALRRGDYDLAYMNPYHYAVFSRASGYNALVAQTPERLKGLIVVRRDSRFKRLEDLAGQSMVFPSPAAFAASLLPRRELAARGIPVEVRFVRSHDSVYFNVQRGFAAAGGGVQRTLDSTSPAARESLRVLWQSPGYPPHPIAAHPRVPDANQRRVQQALIRLGDSPRGRQLLDRLKIQAFAAVEDADYAAIAALDWQGLPGTLEPSDEAAERAP